MLRAQIIKALHGVKYDYPAIRTEEVCTNGSAGLYLDHSCRSSGCDPGPYLAWQGRALAEHMHLVEQRGRTLSVSKRIIGRRQVIGYS